MPINPNIALGVQPIQIADPVVRYGQLATIQNAQQANQLNQLKMDEYQVEKKNKNALATAFSQSLDPASGKVDYNKLTGLMATGGLGANIPDILKLRNEEDKAVSEDAARRAKLMQDTEPMYRNMSNVIRNKNDAVAFLQNMIADPAMKGSAITRIPIESQIANIPDDPQGLESWKKQFALGATKFITENKPVTFAQDTGVGGRVMERPGLGGPATLVTGSEFTKKPTFADKNAAANLTLAQQKFAYEKANPGYTIQQADDGSIVGVNNRTLEYFPVNLGGTKPVTTPFVGGGVAPVPGGAGKRGGIETSTTTPQPVNQQQGVPLKGKSAGLTEAQSNAALFGSAMAQAQQVLNQAEKEGTTTGAGTVNLAQGIVKYVPLGVGDKLVNDIYALAVNDPTKLFGPDVNQQKIGQAQLAFAIAYLRKTSGAAFGPSEVANTIMEYFPAVGEDKSVVKQKAESRKRAIAGLKIGAGREGSKFIEQYESPSGGTSNVTTDPRFPGFSTRTP